jgi:hypothetical protein|tara:strand:- start:987 stop:1163 length:177 start_codon:yes stop_codon:yes gene_type:complete
MGKTHRRNKSGWDDDYQPSYKQPKKVKFSRRKDKHSIDEIENEERTENGTHNRKRNIS